jgi:D-serine deaminase-like pyridoxal phosphate-dependent protein
MTDKRRQILDMLASGKLTAAEAERLIAALERGTAVAAPASDKLKYLRVLVDAVDEHDGPTKVNVRVPMQLLRAGVRLTGVIPTKARDQVNEALRKEGISFDINKLTPDNLEEMVEQLRELSVDVDNGRAKVRVFCE